MADVFFCGSCFTQCLYITVIHSAWCMSQKLELSCTVNFHFPGTPRLPQLPSGSHSSQTPRLPQLPFRSGQTVTAASGSSSETTKATTTEGRPPSFATSSASHRSEESPQRPIGGFGTIMCVCCGASDHKTPNCPQRRNFFFWFELCEHLCLITSAPSFDESFTRC